MKPPKTLTVLVEPDGQGGNVASPSPLLVKGTDEVKFYNKTSGIIKIQFSKKAAFGQSWLVVPPGQDETLATHDPLDLLVCPYAVYCKDVERFAHGSTMPIIIIEPKT